MATTIQDAIDQLTAKATKESTDIDSYNAVVAGLRQALADALAAAGALTPAQQAAFDGVFAAFDANDQKIVDAMGANVP